LLYGNRSRTTLPFQKRFYEKKRQMFFGNKIYTSLLKEKRKKETKNL